eukprot:TRINITY_DN287_c0_g2_i1.p1 TRINITY_DN287_c0_g2~~TRINITY_DN287_c0_g2_i1.p1  ORF type:complete len:462 (-),score=77.79 TRINITY_DN287_c0_g2_i1:728-2113(-)
MSCLKNIVLAAVLVFVCNGVEYDPYTRIAQDNSASSISGEANAGNFQGFQNSYYDVSASNVAINNEADSVSAPANSGSRVFFAGGDETGFISLSNFTNINYNAQNKAVSQTGTANSGQQSVINKIELFSYVKQDSISFGNEATVSGVVGDGKPSAISGVETQAKEVSDSRFINTAATQSNQAINSFRGKAISGSTTSVGEARNSDLYFTNTDAYNIAVTNDGRSISGSQNNVASLDNSRLDTSSFAIQNSAVGEGGDIVAGVQNNLGPVSGSTIFTVDTAAYNEAISKGEGKAIGGVATNVVSVNDTSFAYISGVAIGNRATTTGSGPIPQDSVAGTDVNINEVKDSDVIIYSISQNNKAFNYYEDPKGNSDAIAGNKVTVGHVQNSNILADIYSYDNYAKSEFGDAIAGNKVEIVQDKGGSNYGGNLRAGGNQAVADNGEAVVDSIVYIGSDFDVFPQDP